MKRLERLYTLMLNILANIICAGIVVFGLSIIISAIVASLFDGRF